MISSACQADSEWNKALKQGKGIVDVKQIIKSQHSRSPTLNDNNHGANLNLCSHLDQSDFVKCDVFKALDFSDDLSNEPAPLPQG